MCKKTIMRMIEYQTIFNEKYPIFNVTTVVRFVLPIRFIVLVIDHSTGITHAYLMVFILEFQMIIFCRYKYYVHICSLWVYFIIFGYESVNGERSLWRKEHEFYKHRRSHRRCSTLKRILKNIAKFTGKHLCQSILLRLQAWGLQLFQVTLAQGFSCEFCELIKNTFLQNTSGGLLCNHNYKVEKELEFFLTEQKRNHVKYNKIKCSRSTGRKVVSFDETMEIM